MRGTSAFAELNVPRAERVANLLVRLSGYAGAVREAEAVLEASQALGYAADVALWTEVLAALQTPPAGATVH